MKNIVISVFLVFASAIPAFADQAVTLPEAVRQGLRNNNLLKAEQFAVQAATAEQSVATSRYFPRILFEEAFSHPMLPPGPS